MEHVVATIPTSDVEYDKEEAAIKIDTLIAALEQARDEDGVTHVVGTSGNYRGAKWVRIGTDLDVDYGTY